MFQLWQQNYFPSYRFSLNCFVSDHEWVDFQWVRWNVALHVTMENNNWHTELTSLLDQWNLISNSRMDFHSKAKIFSNAYIVLIIKFLKIQPSNVLNVSKAFQSYESIQKSVQHFSTIFFVCLFVSCFSLLTVQVFLLRALNFSKIIISK